MEAHLVRIAYGLVVETSEYSEDCQTWRMQENKYWKDFQSNFIGAQSDP